MIGMGFWQTLALIRKELLVVLLDSTSRLSIILPPLIQLLIFSFAATLDVKNVSIGIYNRDSGEKGFELVQRFRGSPIFEKISYVDNIASQDAFIEEQKGLMVLSIDEQFSRNLDAEKEAEVQVILDGRRSNSTQILLGYVSQIVEDFNASFQKTPKVALVPRNWFNPNIIYVWYNIPCLVATLAMISCLVVTTQSVARERELGTFDQLLVSPLNPLQILIGKIVPGIIVGIVEGLFMVFMGVFVIGVPFVGSFSLFFISLVVFVTAISGIGIFISSLCYTQQMAMLGSFIFIMPSILLSGFATPIEAMPTWLQPITSIIPLRYMLVISKGVFLKNMTTITILNQLWPIGVIGMVTIASGGLLFRKRLS